MVKNSDLVSVIEQSFHISRKEAETFLSNMVDVINEALRIDKQVKIRGLGTFKLTNVSARESIDVNTGERITIEGRAKITFTPDTTMRDLVNKPFAQFETVVLNDGVDFSDIDKKYEAFEDDVLPVDEEKEPDEPKEVEVVNEVNEIEEVKEIEMTKEMDKTKEAEAVKKIEVIKDAEAQDVVAEKTETPFGDSFDDRKQQYKENILWMRIFSAVCISLLIACGVGAYCFYNHLNNRIEQLTLELAEAKASLHTPLPSRPQTKEESPQPVETKPAVAELSTKKELEVKQTSPKPQETRKVEIKDSEYDKDSRVKYGAYVITGVSQTITVQQGQTLEGLSKAYLGPGMECYLEAVNGGIKSVKVGQKLKIPELKTKKSLRKGSSS